MAPDHLVKLVVALERGEKQVLGCSREGRRVKSLQHRGEKRSVHDGDRTTGTESRHAPAGNIQRVR